MSGTDDLKYAYAELCAHRPQYAKAQAFYDGDVDEVYASDKVARMLAKSGLNDLDGFNFARIPVDAVVNKLRLLAITGPKGSEDDIAELFARSELKLELPSLHRRACSLGDAYLLVWPQTDEDGAVTAVDMFVHGPGTVRAIYDPEFPLRIAYVIKSWTTGSEKAQKIRADLYYPDRIERWVWAGEHNSKRDKWERFSGDGQDWQIEHEWGLPWFHYRTDRPYGRPEHYAAYGPQSIINKLVVSHAATVDFQSLPQRYGLIDPQVDPSGMQSDFDPDSPEDVDGDPESPLNASQLRNDPGEFWMLQGLRGVGQFEAANPDIFLKPFDRYIKALGTVTDTPLHIFDSTGQAVSGESRREASATLLSKAEARQDSFTASHKQAFAHALSLLGWDDPEIDVKWAPLEQVTDAQGWLTVKAKIDAGVPRERALVEAGYPAEIVEAWLSNLDDDAELQRRVDLLGGLGTAVQALGSGVQLGAVSAEQVSVLLDSVLGAVADLQHEATP